MAKRKGGSAAERAAAMAKVALRSFLEMLVIFTWAGAALAGCSSYFLYGRPWYVTLLAVLLTLAESTTIGIVLGTKRAAALGAAYGVESMRLGRLMVRLIFEQLIGDATAAGLARLPLAQAEKLLTAAVQKVAGETGQGGWLRRTIQIALLAAVKQITLARFRAENAAHGGIELARLQAELEESIDLMLVKKLRQGLRLATIAGLLVLAAIVAAQTWVLEQAFAAGQ